MYLGNKFIIQRLQRTGNYLFSGGRKKNGLKLIGLIQAQPITKPKLWAEILSTPKFSTRTKLWKILFSLIIINLIHSWPTDMVTKIVPMTTKKRMLALEKCLYFVSNPTVWEGPANYKTQIMGLNPIQLRNFPHVQNCGRYFSLLSSLIWHIISTQTW